MATKVIHCKFCTKILKDEEAYASHMEGKHGDMIPEDMEPRQFIYYLRTGKDHGECIVCKENTPWNPKTNKYARLCGKQECKDKLREAYEQNMMNKHGKITLLDDPEQQRKMLANRRISGKYKWSTNPKYEFTYTGSYELSFLEFMDHIMDYPPEDIMMPCPMTFYYEYEGKRHYYIPDVYIPSLNLIIEIKDGGSNPNNHPKIQEVDKVKEELKDTLLTSKEVPFDYIKIVDKRNVRFLNYLEKSKKRDFEGSSEKIVMK